MTIITLEKKTKRHKTLMKTKAHLIGVRNLFVDHFCRTFSLFSKDIREKLWMKGHFSQKQRDPQSNKVPNLVPSNHKTTLTNNAISFTSLFARISATCSTWQLTILDAENSQIYGTRERERERVPDQGLEFETQKLWWRTPQPWWVGLPLPPKNSMAKEAI
jgi:hypothetical protein